MRQAVQRRVRWRKNEYVVRHGLGVTQEFERPPFSPDRAPLTFYLGRSCCPPCCFPRSVSYVVLGNWQQGHISQRHGRLNRRPEFSKCSVLPAAGTRHIEAGLLVGVARSMHLGHHVSDFGNKYPRESTGYPPTSFSGEYLALMV